MKRIDAGIAVCVGALFFAGVGSSRAGDDVAKELKLLEGVWKSTSGKKGRDHGYVLVFQGGRMGWQSFHTDDGRFVSGHDKIFEVQLDPKASPKHLTVTGGEGKGKQTRRAIYKLDGDLLTVALSAGLDGERPKGFDDEDAELVVVTRDKKVKLPDLSKIDKRGKETEIEPTRKWSGHIADAKIAPPNDAKPITTAAEFEKVWKVLRGADEVPKVDFKTEFVLLWLSPRGKFIKNVLVTEAGEQTAEKSSTVMRSDDEPKGFAYAICVFNREQVDVVGDRIIVKPQKK